MFYASDIVFYIGALVSAVIAKEYILATMIILYTSLILAYDYYTIDLIILFLASHIIINVSKYNISYTPKLFYVIMLDTVYGILSLSLYSSNLAKYSLFLLCIVLLIHIIIFIIYISSDNIHKNNIIHIIVWSLANILFIINLYYSMTVPQSHIRGYTVFTTLNVVDWLAISFTLILALGILMMRNQMVAVGESIYFMIIILISVGNAVYIDGISLKVFVSPVYAIITFSYAYVIWKYSCETKEEVRIVNNVDIAVNISEYGSISYQAQL